MFFKKNLLKQSLTANSIYLIIGTGASALLGFFFWIIVARSFISSEVGIATTMLSASSLLALLSLCGFDTVFVRYLPRNRKKRSDYINSGLWLSALISIFLSLLFCTLINLISPRLSFIDKSPLYITVFVMFTILSSWNVLTNAIFIAYRRSSLVLVTNVIFSIIKICLPIIFHKGSSFDIFGVVFIALAIDIAMCIWLMIYYFDYKPRLKIYSNILRELKRYALSVYAASILNLLPDSILPIIVINRLGASAAAYFYIGFTIANLLYTIIFSTTQATIAEASHDKKT